MDCHLNRVVFFIRKKTSGIYYDLPSICKVHLPPKHSFYMVLKQKVKTVVQNTLII